METEKLTLNLGLVELGKIDLLVEQGLFSNRSDFIRTAIRRHLSDHDEAIKTYLQPVFPVSEASENRMRAIHYVGVCYINKGDLESLKAEGKKWRITAVGVLFIDKKISAELFAETVESVKVYGACVADDAIKAMVSQTV